MTEPLLLTGSDYERGRQHGDLLRDEIHALLSIRRDEIDACRSHSKELLCENARVHREYSPRTAEEVHGIADGAKVGADEIYLLNGYHRYVVELGSRRSAEECTVFAARRSATRRGCTYLGQQWDFSLTFQPYTHFYLHELPQGGRLLVGGFAGGSGLFGINSTGLGIVLNNLPVTSVKQGVGAFYIIREALRCDHFEDAAEVLFSAPNSTCQNFLLGGPGGDLLDAELAVAGPQFLQPEGDTYTHANHYQHPSLTRYNPENPGPTTYTREGCMGGLLEEGKGRIDSGYLHTCVRNHDNAPASVCVHDHMGGNTNASMIANLETCEVWFTVGNPCMSESQRVQL